MQLRKNTKATIVNPSLFRLNLNRFALPLLSALLVLELARAESQTAPGYLWTIASGTGDVPLAVAVDNQGHVRTAGHMSADLYFHTYDTNGQPLQSSMCTNLATFSAAAIDPSGNVYATGGFGKTGQFGTIKLSDGGNGAMFLAKYGPGGNVLWAIGSTGGVGVYGWAIAVDPSGNAYVTGEFMGSAAFQVRIGTIALNNYTVGMNDAFLAKVDPNGKILWATRFGNGGVRRCMALTVDESGNAYAGANSVVPGGAEQLVYKFNLTGTLAWARTSTPTNSPTIASTAAAAIAVNKRGEVCVTGGMCGTNLFGSTKLWTTPGLPYGSDFDVEVTKYDSAGSVLWACKDGYTNLDGSLGITMDSAGNAFVVGLIDKSTTIGGRVLTNEGYYIAKCNAAGGFAWALPAPHFPDTTASPNGVMAVGPDGSLYFAGAAGNNTSLLSKLGEVEAPAITSQPTNQTILPNHIATLSVEATPARTLTYQWYRGFSGDTSNPIPGAISNVFVTSFLSQTTTFWVRASNPAGYADSATATMTIPVLFAPTVTTEPASGLIARGAAATFTATPSGTAPFYYQWCEVNGMSFTPIAGANSSTYITGPLTAAASFCVMVTNLAGTAYSAPASVRVIDPPAITRQPQSMSVTNGQIVTLSVNVVGGQDLLFFQWFLGDSGDTNQPVFGLFNNFTTPPLTATTHYWVLVRNAVGNVASETAVLSLGNASSTFGALSVSGGRVTFRFGGGPGSRWAIQASSDLLTWTADPTIGTITLGTGGITNIEVQTDLTRPKFYRATLLK